MHKNILFALWGVLFLLCGALGLLTADAGTAGTLLGLAFFLPPAVLLYQAGRAGDRLTLKLIRNLSALSLGLTLALLIANVFSALGGNTLGQILHMILGILSAPMFACGYWALSLFLWACLLMASLSQLKTSRR